MGPIVFNLFTYALMIFWLFSEFNSALIWAMRQIPSWLSFLEPIAWVLFGLTLLLGFGYSFAIFAAIIASPFNGLLAEKVAIQIGQGVNNTPLNIQAISALVKRSALREITKLLYFLPRMILALIAGFLLGFIPVVGLFTSFLVFLWAAWSMCIQYVDYPADNEGTDFRHTLKKLRAKRSQSLMFGSLVTLIMGIPLINLIAMPAAVAGATLYWHKQLSD